MTVNEVVKMAKENYNYGGNIILGAASIKNIENFLSIHGENTKFELEKFFNGMKNGVE